MTVTLIPNVEKVIGAYLRSCDELTDLIDQRVYTEIPKNPVWPLVRLTQVDARPVSSQPLHFEAARLQVDVYGTNKDEPGTPGVPAKELVFRISETARQLLAQASKAEHDGAVITAVRFVSGPIYMPDGAYSPARPRRLLDVNVYLHAA